MDTDASPTATAESGAGLISGEQQQQSADFAMDDKTVVIINIDPASGASEPAVSVAANVAGDGTGEEVVQTAVATSAMDGVDQAEVTIYPQQLATDGSTFVYSSENNFSANMFDPQSTAQSTDEIASTTVALPNEDSQRIVPVAVTTTAVGEAAATSAAGQMSTHAGIPSSIAPVTVSLAAASTDVMATTTAEQHGHATMSNIAITNAQIVTARACPATVQWLIENFETADGISLPRSTLYHFYLRHCSSSKVDAVNAASFGKLIRSVFLGLRTRRLGTRGNSKYHYYGIRIKPTSSLADLPLEDYNQQSQRSTRYRTPSKDDGFISQSFATPSVIATPSSTGKLNPLRHEPHPVVPMIQPTEQQQEQFQQFLALSLTLPTLPELSLDTDSLPDGLTQDHLAEFAVLYKEHCEELVNVIRNFQFHLLEQLWKQFWSHSDGSSVNGAAASTDTAMDTGDDSHRLPGPILMSLCQCPCVQSFVQNCDNLIYQCLVELLVPQVLRPIPSQLTQIIRNLSKNLETWLGGAMADVPEAMAEVKMTAVSALSQTLRRYTSLNHLAQAARAVLQNSSQIAQMLNDLIKVDFQSIQEQATWVCQCQEETLQRIQNEFKTSLQTQQYLEDWATWMEKLVDELLQPVINSADYVKVARQFLLKWSFYSSMVIRDLTLRSAASFGSFHLIRLLYDEYMFYIVEHRVSKALNKVPISILSEFVQLGRTYSSQAEDGSFNADDTMAELNAGSTGISTASVVTATTTAATQEHVIVPLVT
ncbi:DNA-binding protein RFX2-like isoform X2 [Sycon ciliatum]|uniref:DNA-binding protein RFX2-like isoform X2 n=1 Tax=Sycon ciliatum TaxID=27933 RepID=UPI0020AECB05